MVFGQGHPQVLGLELVDLLLLGLHDVGQRRVPRVVEAQVSGDHAGQLHGEGLEAASIWPVWLQSSSIACLPRMTRPGSSFSTRALKSLATCRGTVSASVTTWIARSAPIASAVRSCSCDAVGPTVTATISDTTFFSFRRTASSTAISSKGFMLILTLAVSTPILSGLTRILTA